MNGTKGNQMKVKDIEARIGTLSKPSKMPGYGWSTPAKDCKMGSKLAKLEGTICSICYARKGRYVFPVVQKAMEKRKSVIYKPEWVPMMTDLIRIKERKGFFRWHDSGDIQSVTHLKKIAQIARNLPDIVFWLPTREYAFVRQYMEQYGAFPDNLTVRLSAYMIDGPPPIALAVKLGLPTSGVASDGDFDCPAPLQGGKCVDCRACWDKGVNNINYKKQ